MRRTMVVVGLARAFLDGVGTVLGTARVARSLRRASARARRALSGEIDRAYQRAEITDAKIQNLSHANAHAHAALPIVGELAPRERPAGAAPLAAAAVPRCR